MVIRERVDRPCQVSSGAAQQQRQNARRDQRPDRNAAEQRDAEHGPDEQSGDDGWRLCHQMRAPAAQVGHEHPDRDGQSDFQCRNDCRIVSMDMDPLAIGAITPTVRMIIPIVRPYFSIRGTGSADG